MSDHADTLRRALCGGTTLDEAHTALEALVAENQQLRGALEQIGAATEGKNPMIVGVSVSQIAGFARAALDGTP